MKRICFDDLHTETQYQNKTFGHHDERNIVKDTIINHVNNRFTMTRDRGKHIL